MEKVQPLKLEKDMTVSELVEAMSRTGFGARSIGRANAVVRKMFDDPDCTVFLGQAGAMVPAGMKQLFIDKILEGKVDCFVTTGATLTHDLIEALGEGHYHCDSWDDEDFNDKGYDRMYNVFMKNEVYEKLECFFKDNWDALQDVKNIRELTRKLGELVPASNSILRACFEKDVPIFCPGIADSGIGLMIWGNLAKGRSLRCDVFADMDEIIKLAWDAKKRGVIYVGGGLPKNFIQQSLQFSEGAELGVQITTDTPQPGGSSGAPLEEGKSWGKLKKDAEFVDVFCDATIALPLVFA